MKKYLIKFINFFVGVKSFFTPNEAFFKVVKIYKDDFIRQYYYNMYLKFIKNVKSYSFWLRLFYNKDYGLIVNIFSILLFVPLYRIFVVILSCILALLYSFYYIPINFVFDLIIKYVDVYARKVRVFYDPTLIEDINEVRRIVLFINVKENFFKIFKPVKDLNIDGFIYKEEFPAKFKRIFWGILLFFIWPMPLFLGFISYLVRVFFSIVWSYCRIIFWFFAKWFLRYFKVFGIWAGITLKFYKLRYKRFVVRVNLIVYKMKRKIILRVNKLFLLLKLLIEKMYDNISILWKIRNRLLKSIKIRYLYLWLFKKKKTYSLRYKYFSLLVKTIEISITNRYFFINMLIYIKKYMDNKYIQRLEPYSNNIKDVGLIFEKGNVNIVNIFKFGSIFYKLNQESLKNMVHYFSAINFDNFYDIVNSKLVLTFSNKIYLKLCRFFVLMDWELIFPIYMYFYKIYLVFYRYTDIFISIILYVLSVVFITLFRVLKLIICIILVIFAGRQK